MVKNTKTAVLFLVISIFFISSVNALSFDVNVTPVKNNIKIEEVAKYTFEINNYQNNPQTFRIQNMEFPTWDVSSDPIINPILFDIDEHSKKNINLVVNPLDKKNILTGTHIVKVRVESKTTNEKTTVPLRLFVSSKESLIDGYVPTILTNVNLEEKIDPREEIEISITLSNQNPINYSDLMVKLESDLIKDEIEIELASNEIKTFIVKKKIEDLTEPQKDNLAISVLKGERVIVSPVNTQFEVIEYKDQTQSSLEKKFLKAEKEISFNTNNPECKEQLKVETSLFQTLFSSTSPKAKILQEEDKRYFVWDITLDDDNSFKVKISENYRIILWVFLILIALIAIYFNLRSPLSMRKEIKNITKKEGGIFTLKVVLHVKNRSNKRIETIELTEEIPHIVELERDLSIGTLKPNRILRHEKRGYIVKWEIETLDVAEERVLSYRLRAKLPILGELSLPQTNARFRYNKSDKKTSSNRVNVNS